MKKAAILLVALLMTTCLVFYPSVIEDVKAYSTDKEIRIYVNSTIYSSISTSLNQYISDLEQSGFIVSMTHWEYKVKYPLSIREDLRILRLIRNIVGCVLVGDIPALWFEADVSDSWYDWFPTDFYYMDLDGVWDDTDDDGAYDSHTGNVEPEIWVGRIKADNIVGYGNESDLLNNYFNKIHSYRNGSLTLPKRALLYLDDDIANWSDIEYNAMKQTYDELTLVDDHATTNDIDYKARLNQSHEWVSVWCHGSWGGHYFEPGEVWIPSKWYLDTDPPVFFYNLGVCSGAKYKRMERWGWDFYPVDNENYLAGACIFTQNYGLLAIGSTTEGWMGAAESFFEPISDGRYIGEAFQEWFTYWINRDHSPRLYGVTIIGDPMLKPRSPVTNVTHSLQYRHEGDDTNTIYPRWLVNITVVTKNLGTIAKTFNVTAYASANNVTYSNGTQTTANLTSGAEDTLTFTWDTTDIPWPYTYTISAEARINTTRNTGFDSEPLRVRIPGDTNDDGMVDIVDISFIGAHMGYQWPDEEYDWQADINGDGTIDILDVVAAAIYFGYGT